MRPGVDANGVFDPLELQQYRTLRMFREKDLNTLNYENKALHDISKLIVETTSIRMINQVMKRGRSGVCLRFAFPAGGVESSRAVQIQNPKLILSRSNGNEAVNTKHEAISTIRKGIGQRARSKASSGGKVPFDVRCAKEKRMKKKFALRENPLLAPALYRQFRQSYTASQLIHP